MPRPSSFSEADVIQAALPLFWSQGFDATGISQILTSSGIKPGSFYNAFPSKKDLFVRTLLYYRQHIVNKRIDKYLKQVDDPIAAIDEFFTSTFEPIPQSRIIGCLLTNTATELGASHRDIQKVVSEGMDDIQAALKERIIEAQLKGMIAPAVNAQTLSLNLLNSFQGLSVLGRLTQDKTQLRAITAAALSVLDTPAKEASSNER